MPSAAEILARTKKNYNYDKIHNLLNVTKRRELETLQSVESERITSVYEDDDDYTHSDYGEDEGRIFT